MYDFLSVDLNSAVEPEILPDGTEAEVQITEAKYPDDPAKCYIEARMKVLHKDGTAKSFRHYLNFPKPDDDSEKKNNKLLMLKRFFEAFKVPQPLQDKDQLVGLTAWVLLGVEEGDEQYPAKNRIKAYVGLKK